MTHADIVAALKEKFPSGVLSTLEFRGEHTVMVLKSSLAAVLQECRDSLGFEALIDITTIDQMGSDPRFEIVYELYSYTSNLSLRIKSATSEDEAEFPSVTSVWPAANWHEREAYDMFGIKFEGHPDLRRILMWDGYPYHPLRKEFPLAGIETALPDLEVAEETQAKVIPAPMVGGPFVASSGEMNLTEAEPRAKDESWNERSAKPQA